MPTPLANSSAPARLAGCCAAFALLWIWLSDRVLVWLGYADEHMFLAAAVKDTVFVVVAVGWLFWLARRELRTAARGSAMLRALTEGADDAVFVKDRAGRYLLFNPAAERVTGKRAADVLGRDDTALFDSVGAAMIMARDQRVMRTGFVETEEETLTAGGVTRTFLGIKAPYRDDTGEVVGVVGVSRDVTEARRSEAALRESEQRFRELADSAPVLIWLSDTTKECVWFNRRWLDFVGRSLTEEVGAGWVEGVHPDDRDRCIGMYEVAFDARVPFVMEYRLRRHDGEYRWVIDTGVPRNAGGGFAGYIGSCVDITERKRAEDELRASRDRLRLAQAILDAVGDSILVTEAEPIDGQHPRILYANPAFLRSTGYTLDEVLGQTPRILQGPKTDPAVRARIRAALRAWEPVRVELINYRKDGSEFWVELDITPLADESGWFTHWISVQRDITSRKTSEAALLASEERRRLALEAAHLAVWEVWLPTGGRYLDRVNQWEEAYGRLFGLTPAQLPRAESEFFALVHPDDREAVAAAFEGCVAGRADYVAEFRAICPDGRLRWHSSQGRLLRDAEGNPERVIGVGQDVTDRKEAERTLRLARFSVERAVEAIFWISASSEIQFANEAAHRILRYPPGSLVGRTVPEIDPNFTTESWPAHWQEVKARGSFTFESDHRTADGGTIFAEITVNYLRYEDREFNCAVMRDVTARKRAEAAAHESERRLAAFMENTPTLAWVNDEFGRTHLVNPAWERVYGLTATDLIGRSMRQTLVDQPADDYLQSDRQVLATDRPCTVMETGPREGGEAGTYLVTKFPLGRAADGSRLVGGVAVDITDRAAGEATVRASEERLRLALTAGRMGTFDWDLGSGRVVWSDTHFDLWGYPPDERPTVDYGAYIGRVHADDRKEVEATIEESRRARLPYRHEYRIVLPSGQVRWISGQGEFQCGVNGEPVRMLGTVQDVTDRRRAELAVRESEERLRLALTAAAAIGFVWDAATDAVVRYFSTVPTLPPNADAPEPVAAVRARVHPDDVPLFDAGVAACLLQGTEYRNQYRVVDSDGEIRWLEEWGVLARSADGRPLRLTGISLDVSERKRAEAALRASEERYRRLVEVLPTALALHDGEQITFCNPALVRLLGAASADELVGRKVLGFVHPDYHATVLTRLAAMRTSGQPGAALELRLVRTDGRTVPAYSVATPVSDGGRMAFISALYDLSERERAAQLLATVMASVGDAIVTIDATGTVTSVNPATERLFGYPPAELVGGNVRRLMSEPHRGGHDGYIARYLRTGEPRVIGTGRELEGQRRDGSSFPLELTISEFTLDGERHFTGVLRDITARKRLEEQFRQSQKMEAIGRLAGGVAHDFNNLLTVINGYCELLTASDRPPIRWRESVVAIGDAGERAARLTQQLLAFSRKSVLAPKVIDLNELVAESAKLLRRLIGEHIGLATITAPTPVRVMADPGQMEQVILNLAVNARDAMPTGGRLTIETATDAITDGRQYACLSVTDTGCGMTDEVKGKIFEPFFTTKGVGKGTGLGLAVVHGVVEQSGGRIEVESTVGVGTTFRLLLPLAVAEAGAATAEATPLALRGNETVLLVEDEDAVRTIARLSLEMQGYVVLESDGGAAAVKLAGQHPGEIHLLISDVVMPEMGGRQLVEAVRRHRPGVRVLFMSGHTDDAVLIHGVEEATDAFLQKPFTPLGLVRKVRDVLDAAPA